MLVQLAHENWQRLRFLVRTGERTGRDIRMTMSRKSRDGSYLTQLLNDGLIKVVVPAKDRLDATYALTDLGRLAAEHGEYDKPYSPQIKPLTGLAADMVKYLAASRASRPTANKSKKTKR